MDLGCSLHAAAGVGGGQRREHWPVRLAAGTLRESRGLHAPSALSLRLVEGAGQSHLEHSALWLLLLLLLLLLDGGHAHFPPQERRLAPLRSQVPLYLLTIKIFFFFFFYSFIFQFCHFLFFNIMIMMMIFIGYDLSNCFFTLILNNLDVNNQDFDTFRC